MLENRKNPVIEWIAESAFRPRSQLRAALTTTAVPKKA
jgi:hypothetical protein